MHAVFLDRQTFSYSVDISPIEASISSLDSHQITKPEHVIERCINADIIISNKVILNAEILSKLPQLKLVCIAATGTNNIDVVAAKKYDIAVTNVSGYAMQSVAQYVFSQILAYFSQTQHHNTNCELGLWQHSETFCLHGNSSIELAGKTLGLIGYGNLGKAVETIAIAFGMRVLIAERKNSAQIRAGRNHFNEVIQQADVLSFHCPQTKETENIINKELLSKMKKTAVLINTARGGIVNNQDLHNALKNKEIAFAVLDVLEQEPPPENHLFFKSPLNN